MPTLVWPETPYPYTLLPTEVAKLVAEAESVVYASPSSFVVLIGRALEALCEAHHVSRGRRSLATRIEELGKKLQLPLPFLEMARGIKDFRNFGAHHDEVQIDRRHADAVRDLFVAIVEYVYVLPATIESFRQLAEEVSSTVKRFGQWIVYKDGLNTAPGQSDYFVANDRLNENDWVVHMMDKDWVVLTDFCDALYFARERLKLGNHSRTESHRLRAPFWIRGREDRNQIDLDPFDLAPVLERLK